MIFFKFKFIIRVQSTDSDEVYYERKMRMKLLPLDEDHAKVMGRALCRRGRLYMVQSASGCVTVFEGERLDIRIYGGDRSIPNTNRPRIAVMIDGKVTIKKLIEAEEETFTVIDSKEPVFATVEIVKLSEAAFSIGSAELLGDEGATLRSVPSMPHTIGFIGDSITCGYGVDDSNTESRFATESEKSAG